MKCCNRRMKKGTRLIAVRQNGYDSKIGIPILYCIACGRIIEAEKENAK